MIFIRKTITNLLFVFSVILIIFKSISIYNLKKIYPSERERILILDFLPDKKIKINSDDDNVYSKLCS
jgi:hypothetical protein